MPSRTEAQYQAGLIRRLKVRFPGCVVVKNDSAYQQGFPDLTVFFAERWAALEVKRSEREAQQPNQEHFVQKLDDMSYAAFIYPENEEVILFEMEQAFAS